ncbi:MAG: carboxypeptidase M32 [Proteobacteria bacterium]|nr:carboxypeptidase M32 [Pseudomonadota bacterium]
MTEDGAYQTLEHRYKKLAVLGGVHRMLHWDSQTMMPAGGAGDRAEQTAAIALVRHELLTDPSLDELLCRAEAVDMAKLDSWQAANLAEMRRLWVHANAVDGRLVEALAKAVSASESCWREARPANDFAGFAPRMGEVLALVRETAMAKAEALDCSPYDALLDGYEPHGRSARIDALFDRLAGFLPGFLARVIEDQAAAPAPLALEGPFPIDAQRALGRRLMEAVGFDFDHGRLDESDHPFSSGTPNDTRITTRYDEADFTMSLMAVLHETGHAMYERGLPAAWRYQPVGEAAGMSVHESQSLLLEMQACRSRAFAEFAAPLMREAFGGEGPAWEAENIYRLNTRVAPGLIRVYADEVTYPAHIMLRYGLEKSLISGDLVIADLPGAWADGMNDLLGITPHNDRDGCMQDIHWAAGAYGYFPTYTLGALNAAQLYDTARSADTDIEAGLARGDFKPLLAWLRRHVHAQGASLGPAGLIEQATGRPLDVGIFERHLAARYLPSSSAAGDCE